MSAISLKSITGITSITTPSGVDNQLTLHNNNTTEAVKLDIAGNVHINNQLAITGVTTMTGNLTVSNTAPAIFFTDTNNDNDFRLVLEGGLFRIQDVTAGNVSRFRINSSGLAIFSNNVNIDGDLDVDGHTNLDNVSIAGVSTFTSELVAGVISVQSGGSINIPDKLIHSGDADTAIRFPAADTIRFEVGNQQAVHILPASAGSGGARMGLGTDNPTGMLHIYGSNPPVRIQNSNDSANLQFGMWDTANIMFQASHRTFKFATETSHPIVFHTGGLSNERLRINSSGYIGINDTSNNARLIVSGNSDTSDADCQIRIYDTDSTVGSQIPSLSFWGGSTQLAYIRGTSTGLRFYTGSSGTMSFAGSFDNSQRLLLGSDSNIAVAGSNPRVQVNGTSDSTAHLSIRNFSANTTGAILSLAKSRGGIGAYTAVADDDVLGQINFAGADGTDLAEVAGKITVACDATVAGNRVPSRMEFHTTDGNGNLDLNMVLTRDSQLFLPQGITRDAMFNLAHSSANDFVFGRTSGGADTGMTIVTPSATSGFINFADADGSRQGSILYQHGSGQDKMYFRTNNNQTGMVIDSSQNIGIGADPPQTKLNVRGTISTGRNVARELGTIINISSNHDGQRVGGNVINGKKNYENGANDWISAGGQRSNANLTIDLGSAISCDRFVIYNQNEYQASNREVKRFTLEGSNDNSNWTKILDDYAGCSNAHEPNPGWSFRIPADIQDDAEGYSYRYWRFTMVDYHGSDSYGGVMELELYQTGGAAGNDQLDSEITTHSLVAGDISAQTIRTTGQPAFCVSRSSAQTYSNNDNIIFDDDSGNGFFQRGGGGQYDNNGATGNAPYFNTSTGVFTAPVSGVYFFSTTVLVMNSTGNYDLIIKTSNRDFYCAPGRKASNAGSTSWSTSGTVYLAFGGDAITYMEKADTASVRFNTFGGGQIYGSGSWTRFQGYLIG